MGTGQLRRRRSFVQVAALGVGSAALAASLACSSPSAPALAPMAVASADGATISRILNEQVDAWNRGDLHAFVAGYAEGDRMTYVGKGGAIVRGRAALEERYRKSYPEGRRGTLTFSELDVRRLGPDDYLVLGNWSLALAPDHPHGTFTLVFERGPLGLRIIHDHSSGAD
jgi:uncharacterized protein (TIGR02246 family)